MAGRGARSDRGNVRGALVDEFTHVITGGTTRNCVLKQSSTLLGRCSALCRRREADRHRGRGRGTGCLFGRTRHERPPGENCRADGARTGCSALPGSGQARYRHAAHTRQGARLPEERLRMATVASRGHRAISALCSATALSAAVSPSVQKGRLCVLPGWDRAAGSRRRPGRFARGIRPWRRRARHARLAGHGGRAWRT